MRLKDSYLVEGPSNVWQILSLEPGWYNLRGQIKAIEAGTNKVNSGGVIGLKAEKEASGRTSIIQGTTNWISAQRGSIPIPSGGPVSFNLAGYRRPNGNIFFDDIEVHRQLPPAVEGFLLCPNYRGLLYTDRSQLIELSVTVRPEEVNLTLDQVHVLAILESELGVRVAETTVAPTTSNSILSMSALDAPVGALRLRLQLLHQDTAAALFEYPSYWIVKLSPDVRSQLSVYVDDDNALVLNGKRKFVLGIYNTGGADSNEPSRYIPLFSKLAEAPINMYINYQLGGVSVGALQVLTAAAQLYGIWYLHTVTTWHEDNPWWANVPTCKGTPGTKLGPDQFTTYMAAALNNEPGMAGWYTVDEEFAEKLERTFEQYLLLWKAMRGGITFIAQNRVQELSRWRDSVDVMGVDPYPLVGIPEGQLGPLETITDWVERAQAAVENSRPVFGVIQFFSLFATGHFPTREELRNMSYMAIIAGAKGLFYWSYGQGGLASVSEPALREEYWQRLVSVTKEIKSFEPVLLSPNAP